METLADRPGARLIRARWRRSDRIGSARVEHGADLAAELARAGWRDLTNTRDSVEAAGRTVALVGVDDPHLDRDRFPVRPPEVVASAEAPVPTPELRIGVTHAPYVRVLEAMRADGCDLILAGHTHGGQVCLPGGRAILSHDPLPKRFAKGVHQFDQTWLCVPRGLGFSAHAVRAFCPAEVIELTLTRA